MTEQNKTNRAIMTGDNATTIIELTELSETTCERLVIAKTILGEPHEYRLYKYSPNVVTHYWYYDDADEAEALFKRLDESQTGEPDDLTRAEMQIWRRKPENSWI